MKLVICGSPKLISVVTFILSCSRIHSLKACDEDFTIPSHELTGHMIATHTGVTSYEDCMARCRKNQACYSINYHDTGRCELNEVTHLSHPMNIQYSSSPVTHAQCSSRVLDYCSNLYCSSLEICIVNNDGISYECKECSAALGMESKAISDAQITASSQYQDPGHDPWKARLNLVDYQGSWVAASNRPGEYIQVSFGSMKMISKIAIQGRGIHNQWVTAFTLKHSLDGSTWTDYKTGRTIKVFQGNIDVSSIVTHKLTLTINTKYIRVIAVSAVGNVAMRLEFYGCQG